MYVMFKVGESMKKYLISVFLIIGILFININGVNAANIQGGGGGSDPDSLKTEDGYARCVYAGYGRIYSTIQLTITVYKDTDGVVRSYADMQCAKKGEDTLSHCDIHNYNDIFHNADATLYSKFHDNNGWKCYDGIYATTGNGGRIELIIDEAAGTHFELLDDESEVVNENDSIDTSHDGDSVVDVEDHYSDSDSGSSTGTGTGDAAVDAILDWANGQGYGNNIRAVGDPCNIINNNLKDILSSVFWLISVAGIILVVVMTAISFIKAIVGSDDEKLRNALSHLITRVIVVIILLLLPMLLQFVINLVNDSFEGQVKIGDDGNVFCDITR